VFRPALRMFRQDPGYAVAFVLTLGLGIGATTAIFSAVEGVLIRPLPYPHADRIVVLQQPVTRAGQKNGSFSFVEVADYRAQTKTFDELVEYGDWQFNVVGLGEPRLAYGGLVTSNYFKVLAIRPLLGRTLSVEDDQRNAAPVAVLTYEFWRATFGDDRGAVGKVIELTGVPTTIVGVLEPGSHYAGTQRAELYANYPTNTHYMGASMQGDRGHRMTDVYGLVKAGVPLDTARADLEAIAGRLHAQYPTDYPPAMGYGVTATPWRDVLVKNARPTLLILMGAVGLVLLVACANVGNLTMARLVRRERELAVHTALGATRARLRLRLLAEHLMLSLIGSALGLLVAWVARRALVDYTARLTLRADAVELNSVVLGFSLVVGLGTAFVFAWLSPLPSVDGTAAALAGGSTGTRTTAGRVQRKAQRWLVAAQIAVSFVVLVGAGLLVRTFANLQGVDPGFETAQVLSLRAPNATQFTADKNRQLFDELAARLHAFPGVVAVSTATRAPYEATPVGATSLKAENSPLDGTTAPVQMLSMVVSPEYFSTLKIAVPRGRVFGPEDTSTSPHVAVINETLARLAFGSANPLGRQIDWESVGMPFKTSRTIVGVARDVRELGGAGAVLPTAYEPSTQGFQGAAVLIRTTGDPALVGREATRIVRELDPKRPVVNVRTLDTAAADRIAPSRLNATLFGGFAILALAIAAVGIGGVLAFSVSERTREFGIRMALGSDRRQILQGVLGEGLVLASIGLVAGAIAATSLARFLQTLLFDVVPVDAPTFAAMAALLALVTVGAAWLPARRATRVDPSTALRAS
jgi:putative ABC transport system permease protein